MRGQRDTRGVALQQHVASLVAHVEVRVEAKIARLFAGRLD